MEDIMFLKMVML